MPDPSQPTGHFKASSTDWAMLSHTEAGQNIMRELAEHFDVSSPIYKPHVIIANPAAAELLGKIRSGQMEVYNYLLSKSKPTQNHAKS